MLFVLADAAVTEQIIRQFSESECFVKFPVGQQPGVGRDLAAQKLQSQTAVEIDSQIPVLAVTHWVPLLLWHVERPNP